MWYGLSTSDEQSPKSKPLEPVIIQTGPLSARRRDMPTTQIFSSTEFVDLIGSLEIPGL